MKFTLIYIILLFGLNSSIAKNKSYVLISFSNCTFCNNSLRIIQDNDHFISSSVLLGSAEDANIRQLKSLALDNFKINFRDYKIDTKLYDKLAGGNYYKIPCFAIVNSQNELVFKTTVDSLQFYQPIIKQNLNPKTQVAKLKPISCLRLTDIGGYSSLQIHNEMVGINFFNKSDRIYLLDTKTQKLDSLFFSYDDLLLKKLFKMANETYADPKAVIDFAKNNMLPYDLHHFGSLSLNGDVITSTDHLLYVDLRDTSEMISATWKQFILSISLSKKELSFYYIDNWQDSTNKPIEFRNFDFNDQFYNKESDSTWLVSSKKLQVTNAIDLNLYMVRFKADAKNRLIPIGIDSFPQLNFIDFKGKPLNKPNFIIPFHYGNGLLYFNESPFVLVNKKWVNVQKSIPSLDWIYNVTIDSSSEVLTLMVRESTKKKSIIYYDLTSKQVVNRIALPTFEPKSNVVFKDDIMVFLDSKGNLCRYLIK